MPHVQTSSVGDGGGVAELAGAAAETTIDVSAGDDAEADAAPDGDGEKVFDVVPAAVEPLRDGEGVDVVVDEDRQAECFLDDAARAARRASRAAES